MLYSRKLADEIRQTISKEVREMVAEEVRQALRGETQPIGQAPIVISPPVPVTAAFVQPGSSAFPGAGGALPGGGSAGMGGFGGQGQPTQPMQLQAQISQELEQDLQRLKQAVTASQQTLKKIESLLGKDQGKQKDQK